MAYAGTSFYTIEKLDLITNENKRISLKGVFSNITLVEDIFSNYNYGQVSFEDGNDLQQLAPIVGEEIIEFYYTDDATKQSTIRRRFRVYRVETSEAESDRVAHNLFFVSEEAFADANNSLSRAYKNKSIKFIVRDALSVLSTKKLNIGEFSGIYHMISPNWSPLQIINYTTSIANPANYTGSMVLFYETSNGFNYKHIEELIEQESLGVWSAKVPSKLDEAGEQNEINPSNNISSYTILKNSTDTLKSMGEGLYANATISYDNITKNYKIFKYDYDTEYKNAKHLNKFKLNSRNFDTTSSAQKLTYVPSTSFRVASKYHADRMGNSGSGDNREQIIPWRTSMLSQISAKQIELNVPGNTKLLAGSVINIELPNATAMSSQQHIKHRYNTKKVLITKIVNNFTRKVHKMVLTVADDSYTDTLTAAPEFKLEDQNAK